MLQFSLWQKLLIMIICIVGVLFSIPNVFYNRVENKNDILNAISKGQELSPSELEKLRAWPAFLPLTLVNLGLDLRGGANLLAEVRVEEVYSQ